MTKGESCTVYSDKLFNKFRKIDCLLFEIVHLRERLVLWINKASAMSAHNQSLLYEQLKIITREAYARFRVCNSSKYPVPCYT